MRREPVDPAFSPIASHCRFSGGPCSRWCATKHTSRWRAPLTDPQIMSTFLVALVLMFKTFSTGNLFKIMSRARVALTLMLFVAVCLASSSGSRFPLFSIWRCFEVSLVSLWAFLMIQDAKNWNNPANAVRSFYTISVAILVGVLVGLVINPGGAWAMEGDIARLTGTTGYSINPNDIGAIAAVLAVGCYVRAVERASLKFAGATALFVAVCFLSYSRGSYLALAVALLAATLMLGRLAHRRTMVVLTSFCAALVVAATILFGQEIRNYLFFLMTRGHATENLESFGGRLQLWEFGLQIFKERPFLGTGYGTYPAGLEGGHFHNVFIELLVTTGALGTLSYLVFLVTSMATAKKAIGRASSRAVADRIVAADLVTIPAVIIVANGATAGAAYYSWDLLGLVSVAVAASLLKTSTVRAIVPQDAQPRFFNLLR